VQTKKALQIGCSGWEMWANPNLGWVQKGVNGAVNVGYPIFFG